MRKVSYSMLRLIALRGHVENVDLSGMDLRGIDLAGISFKNCVFKDTVFKANDNVFVDCIFDRCIVDGLYNTVFSGCRVRESLIKGSVDTAAFINCRVGYTKIVPHMTAGLTFVGGIMSACFIPAKVTTSSHFYGINSAFGGNTSNEVFVEQA